MSRWVLAEISACHGWRARVRSHSRHIANVDTLDLETPVQLGHSGVAIQFRYTVLLRPAIPLVGARPRLTGRSHSLDEQPLPDLRRRTRDSTSSVGKAADAPRSQRSQSLAGERTAPARRVTGRRWSGRP